MVVDATFDQALALDLDVLLIPGGLGSGPYLPPDFTTPGPDMDAEISFVRSVFPRLHSLITVCTGAGIAARAGVLDGRRATTNKYAWNVQTTLGHRTHWVAKARWVVDGNVVTCSGVSAGIDGMLAWIGAVWGEEVADTIADGMEFERTKEAGEDRFAALNGCEDVPPKE
jgi:transcriptional regulator GlxA family with amidase domain